MSFKDEFKKQSLPSYAVIRFNKVHSSVRALFGSSIKHSDLISLEIEHAVWLNVFTGSPYHIVSTLLKQKKNRR